MHHAGDWNIHRAQPVPNATLSRPVFKEKHHGEYHFIIVVERMSLFENTSGSGHVKEYKLIVAGDAGVGKTAWVRRLLTGEFPLRYIPTLGVEVSGVDFETNKGPVRFNIWDMAGQSKFAGLGDGYYIQGEAAIVMFDVTARITYRHTPNWLIDIRRVCPDIPICLVGNKCDVIDRRVKAKCVTFHRKKGIPYCDISTKSGWNVDKPLLWIARQLGRGVGVSTGALARAADFVHNPEEIIRGHMEQGNWDACMLELSEFLDKKMSLGNTLLEIMLKETNGGKTLFQCIQTYGYRHASPSKMKCFDCLMYVLDHCQELRLIAHSLTIKPEQRGCRTDYGYWEAFDKDDLSEMTVVDKALRYIDHRALVEFRVWTGLEKTNADVVTLITKMILPKAPARSDVFVGYDSLNPLAAAAAATSKEEDGNVVVTLKGR